MTENCDMQLELPVEINWLINVINNKSDGAKGILSSYDCERIAEGKGFLSRVTRVKFTWDAKSTGINKLPKAVVIKKPTIDIIYATDPTTKEFIDFKDLVMYHNQECRTYEFITKHPPCPIPIAKLFYLEQMKIEDKSSGLIILEDLTDDAVSLEFLEKANVNKIINISGHIGRLQAYGIAHADEIDHYFEPQEGNFYTHVLKSLEGKLPELRNQIGDERMKLSDKQIMGLLAKAESALKICKDPAPYGFTRVVNLGDVQANNILWKRNATGGAGDEVLAFVDFQLAQIGNCMHDIQVILTYCLSTEDRKKYQDSIMDHYLATIQSATSCREKSIEIPITTEEVRKASNFLQAQISCFWLGFLPPFKQFVVTAHDRETNNDVAVKEARYEEFVDRMIDLAVETNLAIV